MRRHLSDVAPQQLLIPAASRGALAIQVGLLSNQGDSGTQPAGLGNGCPGPDAAALGELVGRDHAAMDRIGEGNHSDGTVLQARVGLLFAGRKEAVGIDVQTLRLERFSQEGTVKLSRIRPFCGRILLDQRLRINDLAVAAGGENAAKLLNLTVPPGVPPDDTPKLTSLLALY